MKIMKRLVLFAFALLSLEVCGQQIDVAVGLPIGSNVDNRSYPQVGLAIGGYGSWVRETFSYEPTSGAFESVIKSHLQRLAAGFTPAVGFETEKHALRVTVVEGPFADTLFLPQQSGSRWIVPPEALDVKLNYGAGVGWQIDGVVAIEMDIVTSDGVEHFTSENGGAGASPCYLGLLQDSLGKGGITVVESRYAVPSLQKEIGLLPGSTLTLRATNRYEFVTVSLLDGSVVSYSSPPPAFLKFPAPKLEIVKTPDGGFELSVTGMGGKSFTIESSVDFVVWEPSQVELVQLTNATPAGSAGKKSFRTLGTSVSGDRRFFRLRIEEPAFLK